MYGPSVVVEAFAAAYGCVSKAAAQAQSVILGSKSNLGSTWPPDDDCGPDEAYCAAQQIPSIWPQVLHQP